MTGPGPPALPAVALVFLVLVGSCLGLAPGGDREQTPTVTPAPVPTTEPATPTTVAPGIAADGTVDPSVVVARHGRALSNRSYTATVRRTVTRGAETRHEAYARSWVAPSGVYRLVQYVNVSRRPDSQPPRNPVTDIWFDGSLALFRTTDSAGRPYISVENASREILPDPLFRPLLSDVLSVSRLRPRDADEASLDLVGAPPINRSRLDPPRGGRARNVSLRVALTREGVVRVARLDYDTTVEGERVHVTQTVRVSDVRETDVPAPPWARDRGNSSATPNASTAVATN